MNDLISIIVPVYNVEKYLENCIDSILQQSYSNIEIVIVDDGSEDLSGSICDQYLQKDNRVKVIHQKNGGLSSARNTGLANSSGKYVTFIDSDDYVHPQMIEVLYKNLIETSADISACEYKKTEKTHLEFEKLPKQEKCVWDSIQAMKMYYASRISGVSCCKLYKRKILEKRKFPEGKIHEDEFTTMFYLFYADKIVHTTLQLYYYFCRENSIMNAKFDKKRMDVLDAYMDRIHLYEKYNLIDLLVLEVNYYIYAVIGLYASCVRYRIEGRVRKEVFKRGEEVYKTYKQYVLSNNKIVFRIFMINPLIGIVMRKILDKKFVYEDELKI